MSRLKLISTRLMVSLLGILLFLSLAFAQPSQTADKPIPVVASFSILADLVQQVGGKHVQVTPLIKAGQNAHTFEPSARDAQALLKAELIFLNGLGFEPWLERLKKASGFQGKEVVLSKGITPLCYEEKGEENEGHDEHEGHDHGEYDPHAWQDVNHVIIYVAHIKEALIAADPTHKAAYEHNAQQYTKALKQLDEDIKQTVMKIPKQNRVLALSHNSFAYFAHAYGFTSTSPLGVSAEALPSAAGIAKLILQVRQEKIPALFIEATSNSNIMRQVARETGVAIGGELYTDALTLTGETQTYVGMMRANLKTISQALMPTR